MPIFHMSPADQVKEAKALGLTGEQMLTTVDGHIAHCVQQLANWARLSASQDREGGRLFDELTHLREVRAFTLDAALQEA